jgi:hypothetical protein
MFSAKKRLQGIAFCLLLLFSGVSEASLPDARLDATPDEPYGEQVKDLQSYLNLLNGAEHIRAWFDGIDGVNHTGCFVILESDPKALRIKISNDNTLAPEAEVGVYATGKNEMGDSFLVTKFFKYPTSYLVNLYHQLRSDPKQNGNLTLVLNKNQYSRLTGISISNGQGIANCSSLVAR